MAADGRVLSSRCSCPYDDGPVCKHVAAVLLACRGERRLTLTPDVPTGNARLSALVAAASPAQLAALLLSLAERSPAVADRIRLELGEGQGEAAAASHASQLIGSAFAHASDGDGFVEYHHVPTALQGAEQVRDLAQAAWDEGRWARAVQLDLAIVAGLASAIEMADASDGYIAGLADESLERLRLVDDPEHPLEPPERARLFHLLLEAARRPDVRDAAWNLPLVEAAANLATAPALRAAWDAYVDEELEIDDGSGAERLAMIGLGLIRLHDGEAASQAFLRGHIHLPALRQLAIREALQAGQPGEALRIADEGERQDHLLPGLVIQWKQWRHRAADAGGLSELSRRIAGELVAAGDGSYFEPYKAASDPQGWPQAYLQLLEQLEEGRRHPSVYIQVLVAEHDTPRLLAYCQWNRRAIDQLYPHLVPEHLAEVAALLTERAEDLAAQATTRGHCQAVCAALSRLADAGCPGGAQALGDVFRARYPRKPAFIDELRRWQQNTAARAGGITR